VPPNGWRERGVTSVEYALMVAVIAILLVTGVVALFGALQERFERDADCAAQSYQDVGC
jgi:Flp pilus assembly pilin Flp